MKKANIIASILLIGFTGYYAYLTSQLPTRNLPHTLGVDFMPWLLVGLLSFLSLLLLIGNLFKEPAETFDPKLSPREGTGILLLTVAVYFYVVGMKVFGFVWITPLFVAFLMFTSGSRKWREIVWVSIISSVCIYIFFQKMFRVILPAGNYF